MTKEFLPLKVIKRNPRPPCRRPKIKRAIEARKRRWAMCDLNCTRRVRNNPADRCAVGQKRFNKKESACLNVTEQGTPKQTKKHISHRHSPRISSRTVWLSSNDRTGTWRWRNPKSQVPYWNNSKVFSICQMKPLPT